MRASRRCSWQPRTASAPQSHPPCAAAAHVRCTSPPPAARPAAAAPAALPFPPPPPPPHVLHLRSPRRWWTAPLPGLQPPPPPPPLHPLWSPRWLALPPPTRCGRGPSAARPPAPQRRGHAVAAPRRPPAAPAGEAGGREPRSGWSSVQRFAQHAGMAACQLPPAHVGAQLQSPARLQSSHVAAGVGALANPTHPMTPNPTRHHHHTSSYTQTRAATAAACAPAAAGDAAAPAGPPACGTGATAGQSRAATAGRARRAGRRSRRCPTARASAWGRAGAGEGGLNWVGWAGQGRGWAGQGLDGAGVRAGEGGGVCACASRMLLWLPRAHPVRFSRWARPRPPLELFAAEGTRPATGHAGVALPYLLPYPTPTPTQPSPSSCWASLTRIWF